MATTEEIATVSAALLEIREALSDATPTAHVREVLARVTTYEHTVERWTTVAPSHAQFTALEEIVRELHDRIVLADRPTPEL